MNSNSLPIALMTSLITTFQDPHGLSWGDDDSKDKQLGRSLSYLIVFSTLGLISRWSYGVKLLSASVGNDPRRIPSSDEQSDQAIDHGLRSPDPESVPFLRSNSIDELTSQSDLDEIHHPISTPRTHSNPYRQTTFESDLVPSRSDVDPSTNDPSSQHPPPSSSSPLTPTPASPSKPHDPLAQPGLLRPIFHSFPNVREYWSHSISSKRNSLSTSYTISTMASGYESIEPDPQPDHHTIVAHSIIPDPRPRPPSRHPVSKQIIQTIRPLMKRTKKFVRWLIVRPMLRINQFMTPPLYSAFLSLVVVCLPSLQSYLEKISPLRSALKSAGNVSVPLTLVVLGAYFHTTHDQSIHSSKSNDLTREPAGPSRVSVTPKSSKSKQTERLTIVASILSRMIITPLILVPLLFIVLRYFHRVANEDDPNSGPSARFHEDPCFILVTVLLIGAPPAITLAQMTSSNPYPKGSEAYRLQASQNSRFEKLVSRTLLISYAIITPPTTIALVVLGLLIEANR